MRSLACVAAEDGDDVVVSHLLPIGVKRAGLGVEEHEACTIRRPSRISQGRLVIEQGDAGSGAVSREQVAEVLIRSLLTDTAVGKTFELYATAGQPTTDWEGLFSAALPDAPAGPLQANFQPAQLVWFGS